MGKMTLELPLSVGDHVWINGKLSGGEAVEYEVCCVCTSTVNKTSVWFYAETPDKRRHCTFHDYQIGKIVFLSREDALRGGKEDGN